MILFIVVIALGWLGFAVWWGRNRLSTQRSLAYAPNSYGLASSGIFAVPQTEHMARLRRQQVLSVLVGFTILTLIMTRLWSLVWVLQIAADIALIAFAVAWYARSNPRSTVAGDLMFEDDELVEDELLEGNSREYEPQFADASAVGPVRFHEDEDDLEVDHEVDREPVGAHF